MSRSWAKIILLIITTRRCAELNIKVIYENVGEVWV